jgi:Protein of unknown function (DUF3551)
MRGSILFSGLLAAAFIAAPQPAAAQVQEKAFCLETATGSRNCLYDTFEQCQQVLGSRAMGGGCVPNPEAGTTGRGGGLQQGDQPIGGGGGQQRQDPTDPRR